MEQNLDLARYVAALRRRYLYLVVPGFLIFAATCLIAYLLPRVYEAQATILVESQQIPTDLASPTVTANASERIQVIKQRLMTRDNLLKIADKFELYRDKRPPLSPTDVVDRMRKATTIEQIDVGSDAARREVGVIGFTISFAYSDAGTASRVANEFVGSILSQNIQSRLTRAGETSKFFEDRLAELDKALLAMEARLADFKRINESALPDTLPYRRTLLLQLDGEITEVEQKIQLASLPADATGDLGNDRVRDLNHRLQVKQIELNSDREDRAKLAPLAEKGIVPTNRIRDLDRAIATAELDIEGLKTDIASQNGPGGGEFVLEQLEKQRTELEQRAAALNDSILKTPQVEGELNALTRAYDDLRIEYQQAKAKLVDASTGERLEEDRQAERFEIIEQATVPEQPVKPNRPRIILAGSFGSLAVGVGAVVLMESADKSIRTAADLQRLLQLRPIATIPLITTTEDKRRRRWRFLALLVLVVAVFIGALLVVHWYYLPLDLLMDKVLQRVNVF